MNIQPLKKSILRESVIIIAALSLSAAAAFYTDTVYEDFLKKKNKLEQDANQLLQQKTAIETKYTNFQKERAIYNEAEMRSANPGLYIDRDAVKDLFNIYRSQFYLTKISIDMQPVADSTNPKFVRKNFVIITSDVSVDFQASIDTDIYDMIKAMQKELPGTIKVTSLSLKKKEEFSENALRQIRTQGSYPLVEGTMKFTWFGLKSTDPNSTENKYVIKKRKKPRRADPMEIPPEMMSPDQLPPGMMPPAEGNR